MTSDQEKASVVAVLLANRNGERWLSELLRSLQSQQGVTVRLFVSDNASSDGSLGVISSFAGKLETVLLPVHPYLDRAGLHFFRMIRDAKIGDAEYVAFADNDDVWLPEKLRRAVEALVESRADGYSSRVTPFRDGRCEAVYGQSTRQKRYDYLFETGGAGCTIVVRRRLYDAFRTFLGEQPGAWDVYHHDWTLYAFARHRGYRWHIDPRSFILYRQHGGNETGVNRGMRAALRRLGRVRDGWYLRQVAALARLFPTKFPGERILRLGTLDRLVLALNAYQCRRRLRDVALLAVLMFLMGRGANSERVPGEVQ